MGGRTGERGRREGGRKGVSERRREVVSERGRGGGTYLLLLEAVG